MENQKLKFNNQNLNSYTSVFSTRYGSDKMRNIFSDENKYKLWRQIWVELARAQNKQGLVSDEELADLVKNQDSIDIERILEIEQETKHDVVAGIREFAEVAKVGGGKIHLGATSMDINDNTDALKQKEALLIIEKKLKDLLEIFASQIRKYSDLVCMGYTHLQAAEPTTLGYRLAFYAQDLLMDLQLLEFVKKSLKTKGMKGAVGTSASYISLSNQQVASEIEQEVMGRLGLDAVLIANQTAPRKIDLLVANLLSSIAQSLNKFAFDLRIMQSVGFGEWMEPFGKNQVGSSAMPFKRNPIKSEQICSLARLVESLSRNAWDNAASTLLERTLDDSANRRVYIPEMFLSIDEMLTTVAKIVDGLVVQEGRIKQNLDKFWPFAASELIIVEAVKKGANRQKMHEVLREIAMIAWEKVQIGGANPIEKLLNVNPEISKFIDKNEISQILNATGHTGNAKEKALTIVSLIDKLN